MNKSYRTISYESLKNGTATLSTENVMFINRGLTFPVNAMKALRDRTSEQCWHLSKNGSSL